MRIHNYIMAALFALLALGALYAALFKGATHQLLMAAIGFGVAAALYIDAKKLGHGK